MSKAKKKRRYLLSLALVLPFFCLAGCTATERSGRQEDDEASAFMRASTLRSQHSQEMLVNRFLPGRAHAGPRGAGGQKALSARR